jgi:hypothetical protein
VNIPAHAPGEPITRARKRAERYWKFFSLESISAADWNSGSREVRRVR